MEQKKDVDHCIEFIQARIEQENLTGYQHTNAFAAALMIGMEAGIKQAKGEFSINNGNKTNKGKSIMKKITSYFSLSLLLIAVLALSGCNGTNQTRPDQLPPNFMMCESRLTGETFKYTEKTKYPEAFCVNQRCVDIYEITDLSGNRIVLNEHELRDEWVCSIINK